jgi:hypothetical protein
MRTVFGIQIKNMAVKGNLTTMENTYSTPQIICP